MTESEALGQYLEAKRSERAMRAEFETMNVAGDLCDLQSLCSGCSLYYYGDLAGRIERDEFQWARLMDLAKRNVATQRLKTEAIERLTELGISAADVEYEFRAKVPRTRRLFAPKMFIERFKGALKRCGLRAA